MIGTAGRLVGRFYTMAMIQASFANAAELFNSLLGPRLAASASECLLPKLSRSSAHSA
jgi:hypothetical protein